MRTAATTFLALALGVGYTPTAGAELPTVTTTTTACSSDLDCARHDTWLAQDIHGVPVWADTPHVTPHVDELPDGGIRLSCDTDRVLVDTDEGAACFAVWEA